MLSEDLLDLAFDYLDALDCRRAAFVSTVWMQTLGSRYIDVGRTSVYSADDAARYLIDKKAPLHIAASLTVWSGLWQNPVVRECLHGVRVLCLDVFCFTYRPVQEDGGSPLVCPLPARLRRFILRGPMTEAPQSIVLPPRSCLPVLPDLEDIMVNGEVHPADFSELLRVATGLRTLHTRDVHPLTILGAFDHLPVSGQRLRCLHIVNPNRNGFSGQQVLDLLRLLEDAYCCQPADAPPRLTGLSLPVDATSDEALWRLSRLLTRVTRPGAVVELVSIHRVFTATPVWRTLLDSCEPSIARVYWSSDDLTASGCTVGARPCTPNVRGLIRPASRPAALFLLTSAGPARLWSRGLV